MIMPTNAEWSGGCNTQSTMLRVKWDSDIFQTLISTLSLFTPQPTPAVGARSPRLFEKKSRDDMGLMSLSFAYSLPSLGLPIDLTKKPSGSGVHFRESSITRVCELSTDTSRRQETLLQRRDLHE